MLTDNIEQIVSHHNSLQQKHLNAQSKKKAAQAPRLSENDILSSYTYLPFQAEDVVKIFPVTKQLSFKNNDVRGLISQANGALREQQLDKAFDLYSQANNLLLQISAVMNDDVATCISQIASIQFKLGDFLQAIELQTRVIILLERLHGNDDPRVAHQYLTLSMYYHSCGYFKQSFAHMYRCLDILQVVAGDCHPEIPSINANLGLMFEEVEQFRESIDAYQLCLQQLIGLYGKDSIQVAGSYQALAQAYSRQHDFKKAFNKQETALRILQKSLPADSPLLLSARKHLDFYLQQSVNAERQKKQKFTMPQPSLADRQKLIEAIQAAQKRNAETFQAQQRQTSHAEETLTKEEIEARIKEQQRAFEMETF